MSESTDLIVTSGNGGLASLDEVERVLGALVERKDGDALGEIASRAAAAELWQRRNGFDKAASHYGRLKLLTEACLGEIDLAENPLPPYAPFVVAGQEIQRSRRTTWRVFGLARERGVLNTALDELVDDPDLGVGAYWLYRRLSRMGVLWVPTKPLRDRYRKLRSKERLSIRAVAMRAGVSETHARAIFGGRSGRGRRPRVHYRRASLIGGVLGMDPVALPLAPEPRPRTAKRRRHLPPRRPRSGGRWDEAYARFRRALDEFASVAGEGKRYDEAYAHFYALEEIIGKAMKTNG